MDDRANIKYLYHFTNLGAFWKIWESKTLKFGSSNNVNDISELYKMPHCENYINASMFRQYLNRYKQISLSWDTDKLDHRIQVSSLLWGHYGNSARGVCLVIDFKKLNVPKDTFADKINYKGFSTTLHIPKDHLSNDGIQRIIDENYKQLFFEKSLLWMNEYEYRLVSREHECLDIKDSLVEIIITSQLGYNPKNTKTIIEDALLGEEYEEFISKLNNDKIKVSRLTGYTACPRSGLIKQDARNLYKNECDEIDRIMNDADE